MSGLTPHPWDEVASRIYPGAQTVADAEAAKEQAELDRMVRDIRDHRHEASDLMDRSADEDNEGDEIRDRLVERVGEERARELVGDTDWSGMFG